MERLKFINFDVLTNDRRNDLRVFWGSTYKALHSRTQGFASALKRSTSAQHCRPKEEPKLKSSLTESVIHERDPAAEDLKCSMAELGSRKTSVASAVLHKGSSEESDKRAELIQMVKTHVTRTSTEPELLRTDDAFILRFLRARKFDVGASFRLYNRYFEYRRAHPEIFQNLNITEPSIRLALLDGFPGVLPSTDDHGRTVLVFFTANWDHDRYGLLDIYRALLLSLEHLQVDSEEVQINGFVLVVDWSGFTFRQSSFLHPKLLKLFVEGLQDCFPGRFAGIHFVNQPWYIEAALTLIKSFLKEKTKDKFYLHGNNLTTLHRHIAKEILPTELGGLEPPYNIESWAKKLMGDDDYHTTTTDSSQNERSSAAKSPTAPSGPRKSASTR